MESKDKEAAQRAGQTILAALQSLTQFPERGKEASWIGDNVRELFIDFSNAGYIAAYRLENEQVVILALKHQKESGY